MCGIAGILDLTKRGGDELRSFAEQMASTIMHRGPDDAGVWSDDSAGVALSHRRLSVLDLSPAGHQPMISTCKRYVLVFNGEVFNHLELRRQLESEGLAPRWRGHSDTETLLGAIGAWGINLTIQRSIGQFALGLWDRHERVLHLIRDRLGEKPIYYGWARGCFAFASELSSFKAIPGFEREIDRSVLALYFQLSYVPAPYSIYRHVYKLEPACHLALQCDAPSSAPTAAPFAPHHSEGLQIERFWSLREKIRAGGSKLFNHDAEAVEALEDILRDAIRLQSIADVPLGAFLSGGIDSSTVVALMQAQSSRPIQTFTIGFDQQNYDESVPAQTVATHLQTEHTQLVVTANDALKVVPKMSTVYCEPFADSSQVPTYLVMQMASRFVTVGLSGDGGDELFGGYNRYVWAPRVLRGLASVPEPLRNQLARFLRTAPAGILDLTGSTLGVNRMKEKAVKLADRIVSARSAGSLYESLVREWPKEDKLVIGSNPLSLSYSTDISALQEERFEEWMMKWDTLTYLPDDILTKVDRASMSVSLETRVPFLDHRVVELAWKLPLNMRIRRGKGKWALRQVLKNYVPPELTDRPKSGFAIPIGEWLRGPLGRWAEPLLCSSRIRREGFLDPTQIGTLWHQHRTGERDWTSRLWSVLMFQSWLELNG